MRGAVIGLFRDSRAPTMCMSRGEDLVENDLWYVVYPYNVQCQCNASYDKGRTEGGGLSTSRKLCFWRPLPYRSAKRWTTSAITWGQRQQRCIISVYVGHDERSGSEPDIRPGCPVAGTPAIGSLGSGKSKNNRRTFKGSRSGFAFKATTTTRIHKSP